MNGGDGTVQGVLAQPLEVAIAATTRPTSPSRSTRGQSPVRAARQRKLHVGHFAFMRSVVQGLDPRQSWERYFRVEGELTDLRVEIGRAHV